MKQLLSRLFAIFFIFFSFTNCSSAKTTDDADLLNQIKISIKKAEFWEKLYSGIYFASDGNFQFDYDGYTYESFIIKYSEISDELLEVCDMDFDDFSYNSENQEIIYSKNPFNSINEIKKNIETVYTDKYVSRQIYSTYDKYYIDHNGLLLKSFGYDTIYPYSIDYDTVSISELSENELAVNVCAYYYVDNDKLQLTYYFILDNGIWKIDNIR